jgi:HEAT repeat protein
MAVALLLCGCGGPATPEAGSPRDQPEAGSPPQPAADVSADIQKSQDKLKAIYKSLGDLPVFFGYCDPQTGKPILSWRVALLGYLGLDDLHKQFQLDQPWDSPHNRKLLAQMPEVLKPVRGGAPEGHTYYQVFAGDQALFPAAAPPGSPRNQIDGRSFVPLMVRHRFITVTDGTANTLMIVEGGQSVPWTKPDELIYDPKKPLPRLGGQFDGDFNALLCNGDVTLIRKTSREATLRALITPAGGEYVDLTEIGLPDPYKAERDRPPPSPDEVRKALPRHLEVLRRARSGKAKRSEELEAWIALQEIVSLPTQVKEALPVYIELVEVSGDLDVRATAIAGLVRFGKEGVGPLVKLLPGQDILQALEKIGPEAVEAVPALVPLATTQPGPIQEAVKALAAIGPGAQAAVPALTERLKGTNPQPNDIGGKILRFHLARALVRINPRDELAIGVLEESLALMGHEAAHEIVRLNPKDERAVRRLIEEVRKKREGSEYLGELGPAAKEGFPVVAELLEKASSGGWPNVWEKRQAAAALVRIDRDAAVPLLIRALNDKEPNVRLEVIRALGEAGPAAKSAVPAILEQTKGYARKDIYRAALEAVQKIQQNR